MAITDDIFMGQDVTIQITVKDDNDTVIDLDTASEIIVRLLDEGDNTLQAYNKAGGGIYDALDIATPSSGIMDLHLNAAQTDTATLGAIRAEIKMRFTDVDFDDNTQDSVTVVKGLARLVKSETITDL